MCLESNATESVIFESILNEIHQLSTTGFTTYYAPWKRQVIVKVHILFFVGDTPQQQGTCW